MSLDASVAANLSAVRDRIATAAGRVGRDPSTVCLVAVSKTQPPEAVIAAYRAGQRDFGENRVQEAVEKAAAVSTCGMEPIWHLIGHLQTNKVRSAAGLFAIIHSIDSTRLARTLSQQVELATAVLPEYAVLVEVNVSGEASKGGFAPEQAEEAVSNIRALSHLSVRGLMTVAPLVDNPEQARPVFRRLAEMARRLDLAELSMGMSNDFEIAVEEGATMVRVGAAIFAHRPDPLSHAV